MLPFVRINQNNSFHLCLSSPSQIFFPLYQTQICFQQWISSYQQFFFSWALQCTHRDCLIHSLKSEWLFSYLAQSISANVLHLNWSLYVWIVDQLKRKNFLIQRHPQKCCIRFEEQSHESKAHAADFFGLGT